MFKRTRRVLLTAVIGGGLLLSIPAIANANPHSSNADKVRHDHAGDQVSGYYGPYGAGFYGADWWGPLGPGYTPPAGPWGNGYVRPGTYEYGRLLFTGFNSPPRFYFAPPGIGAEHGYYLPYLTNYFGDDYYATYGYRCNGYRDGYYYGAGGRRWSHDGVDYFRRNADCDDYYAQNGSWYGMSVCDAYDDATGYCDN